MKIIDQTKEWRNKVNFIDDNDVFVGYDLSQDCCENANWYIADRIIPYSYDDEDDHKTPDVSDYNFDPNFFQDVEGGALDSGRMVVFKLVAQDKPDLYLHLFNAHNGYYGHGFEVKHNGEIVREEYL